MKRKFALLLAALLLLAGCGGDSEEGQETSTSSEGQVSQQAEETKTKDTQAEEKEPVELPGTYTVPEGWVELEQYSTGGAFFYVQEGQENEAYPDNIAISVGENPYSLEEHELFREAIVQQLMMQLQGVKGDLKADGTHTAQDYILYTFMIDEGGIITKQFYIVDDYRFCLVHLTNFSRSEDANAAAQAMVDSFVWTEQPEAEE